MEKIKSCLICGNTEFVDLFSCKDYVASNEIFSLQKCNRCSFIFTNPRPEINDISRYYTSENYISHAGKKSGFIYKIYDFVRDFSINNKLRLIKKYHKSGKLIDIGCGLGYFLNGAVQSGVFDSIGIDISDEAAKFVKGKFNIDIKKENELELFPENSFDIITQWHVLEHVQFLNERMQQLSRLLKSNGTLFIAVPNSDSFDAKYYKSFWDAYDVPRHLYHFNQKSFNELMQKHGFKIVETKHLLFDAPYVSMRSEIHKKNMLPFLFGGIIGIVSNCIAFLSNKNYSSLLFVVKKA